MNPLQSELSGLLTNPEQLSQMKQMIEVIKQSAPVNSSESSPAVSTEPHKETASKSSGHLIETLSKLLPILDQSQTEDPCSDLLMALRPFVGDARRLKIDEAIKILRLLQTLPLLQDKELLAP